MKRVVVGGVGFVVALMGCTGDSNAPKPATTTTSTSSLTAGFAALKTNAQTHVAIDLTVTQKNIVSDIPGVAPVTDPNLLNAWGLAFNPAGPAWVSANGNGTSQVYDDAGTLLLSVTIPPPAGGMPPSTPTGQVFNHFASTGAFAGDLFIFATEDGTIAGWQPACDGTAVLRFDNSASGAVYKGVTIAHPAGGSVQLYAANFHAGTVDVFDEHYAPITVSGAFQDSTLPAGFAPFNVFGADSAVIVTYAKQDADAHDDVKGPGNGFVDLFSADGVLLQRLVSGGHLNSPWGTLLASDKNDPTSIDLVVGNFGDGTVNVFNLTMQGSQVNAPFEGSFADAHGNPLVIDGLWALVFGSGASGF